MRLWQWRQPPDPTGPRSGSDETIAPMSENSPALDTTDTSDQVAVRKSKRERLLARGEEAYPVSVPVTATIAEVRAKYGHLGAGEETQDEVGVAGRVVFQRNTGKLAFITLQDGAAKAVRPLPVLHADLSEESRVRHRYVDLIVRQEARDTVRQRAEVMHSLRTSFHDREYVEIETPMLQVIPSGAAARPFVTHMHA